jgi:hypothetical protein
VEAARNSPDVEHTFVLPGDARVVFFTRRTDDVFEVWIAMPTLAARPGLTPPMRALVLAVLREQLHESIWEQRYDWPTRALQGHEIAYLGLT